MDDITREWIASPADEIAVSHGCYFSETKARHVIEFFEVHLRHTIGKWAGEPLILMDWQKGALARLFGWQRPDGTRRYRRAYWEVPKKNGKSTMCSGIALYLLAADGEMGSQVYCAACDREQASIVFREALNMARGSKLLKNYLHPSPSTKVLAIPSTNSFLKAISRESYTNEGLNIHGLIFDELHAQKTRDLYDALQYGGASRTQPLQVAITTAGFDRNSICFELHEISRKILEGTLEDDEFFPIIHAADPEDDWMSPETWRKANPSLGVTIREEDLAADCKRAQYSPSFENSFKRYRLNMWTEQDVRAIPLDRWDACATPVDTEALKGKMCYGGLDLSSREDTTAFVLVFPHDDGSFSVLPRIFLPKEGAARKGRDDRVPYVQWAQAGAMELTEGNVVDYDVVRKRILEDFERYDIRSIAVDRWQANQISTQLSGDGISVVAFGQGFASMSSPTKELLRLLLEGKIAHGGHPVLRWMASNLTVETDAAENMKPKKVSRRERVDGIVALIMALGRAITDPLSSSVYEARGLLKL